MKNGDVDLAREALESALKLKTSASPAPERESMHEQFADP